MPVTHAAPATKGRTPRGRKAKALDDPFLARIVHELGQPLHTIQGALRLVGHSPLRLEQARALRIAGRQTAHAVRLVEELLHALRSDRRAFSLRTEEFDLRRVVREAGWNHSVSARQAGLKLTLVLGGGPLKVSGDQQRLQQVFSNLLVNAIKFTPRHGRISVAAERVGRLALVRVLDTGAGIRRSARRKIFAPFKTSNPEGGLGLGLAIAREIIDAHGGNIAVQSPGPDRGTEFLVTIPLVPGIKGSVRRRRSDAAIGRADIPSERPLLRP